MKLYQHIGNKIKELRESRNMSQVELARALNECQNNISRWETTSYKPSIEDLIKLSHYFGFSIESFLPPDELPVQHYNILVSYNYEGRKGNRGFSGFGHITITMRTDGHFKGTEEDIAMLVGSVEQSLLDVVDTDVVVTITGLAAFKI